VELGLEIYTQRIFTQNQAVDSASHTCNTGPKFTDDLKYKLKTISELTTILWQLHGEFTEHLRQS